jgi:paired amphipathic helix protein Sin3a
MCERLHKIYKYAILLADQDAQDKRSRDESVAEALKLRKNSDIAVIDYYPVFLDIVRNLLDGNMDATQYEDTLREMFGINAFIVFTLDKVVHNCVRQLQYLVQDETSVSVKKLYNEETTGNGGKCTNMSYANVQANEIVYQKKAESLLSDENCYKIISYKNSSRLTIELIETQTDEGDDEDGEEAECEKWVDFLDRYNAIECNNELTDEIKTGLLNRCVFLTRNAHYLKHKFGAYNSVNKDKNGGTITSKVACNLSLNEKFANANNNCENKVKEVETSSTDNKVVSANNCSGLFKQRVNELSFMYRRNSLKNAKKVFLIEYRYLIIKNIQYYLIVLS